MPVLLVFLGALFIVATFSLGAAVGNAYGRRALSNLLTREERDRS